MKGSLALVGALLLLAGCDEAPRRHADAAGPAPVATAGDVVARYAGGEVSFADVDTHILQMPAAERPPPGADLDAWYTELIRTLVVDRIVLQKAREAGLHDSAEFNLLRGTVERQLSVQSCLARWKPELLAISAEDVRSAYAERAETLTAPERRSLHHIYRRLSDGESVESLEADLLALRERVLRGENFQHLARAESDSESRHRLGSLGWVVRDELPAAFEKVVFSLEEGVPSRPLVTGDGAHLFLVDEVLPERRPSLPEVAAALKAQLEAKAVDAALEEVAAANASPRVTMIDRDTLQRLIDEGAEQQPVLVAGDYTLSLAQFRTRLGRVVGDPSATNRSVARGLPIDLAWEYLKRMHRHEAAFEYCVRENLVATEAVARSIDAWQETALTDQMRRQLLTERVLGDIDRLKLYYQSNIGQFTPPVQWQLRRLTVPFSDASQGKALMARLEQAAADGSTGLAVLQQETGGRIDDIGRNTLAQLRRIDPELPQLVSPLDDGALTAPLRLGDELVLFQVLDRRELEPRPFEDVRDAVAAAYLRQYTSDIYDRLEADMLHDVGFELFPDRLSTLREAGLQQAIPEISAEQLDALLSGS